VISALAFLLLDPGPLAARPGELLVVLDDRRLIRAEGARYDAETVSVDPVGAQSWIQIEAGNGCAYNPTTRVLTCIGCMFADSFEEAP
jgi:hypothetical protein